MEAKGATSKIRLEIDHFLFYRKSRMGLLIGKLLDPLISNGSIFLQAGENCKIKYKIECVDFSKIANTKIIELNIRNSCEEKMFNGATVKQFTADIVTNYILDERKSTLVF